MPNIANLIHELPWHPERRWARRRLSEIDRIVVHQELADGSIEAVNDYHITPGPGNHLSRQGAPHFAYHFGIRQRNPDGEIVQANELAHSTWHCAGQNRRSVGIMLEGNFRGPGHDLDGLSDGPTDAQMASLEELVHHLLGELELTRRDVYGHYHFGKRACPGYVAMAWVEAFRGGDLSPHVRFGGITTVRELQGALAALGCEPGPVDGIMGRRTAGALRRFQADNDLAVDGILGPNTRAAMLEALAEQE